MKVGLNKACFGLNVNTVTQELSGKAEIHKHDCCASSCLTGRGGGEIRLLPRQEYSVTHTDPFTISPTPKQEY